MMRRRLGLSVALLGLAWIMIALAVVPAASFILSSSFTTTTATIHQRRQTRGVAVTTTTTTTTTRRRSGWTRNNERPACSFVVMQQSWLNNDPNEDEPFNPFQPSSSRTSSSSPWKRTTDHQVSLRDLRMREVTSELMEAFLEEKLARQSSPSSSSSLLLLEKGEQEEEKAKTVLWSILEKHKEFLLEPLEDPESTVLDSSPAAVDKDDESAYDRSEISRGERYERYRRTMDERLSRARNPDARTVLEAMKDFVLSHK